MELMLFEKPILYQWQPAKGTESIFPRCVIIHRLFHQLNIPYEYRNVGLPSLESEFDDALKKLLVSLPVLENKGTYYKSTLEIIQAICNWDDITSRQKQMAETHLETMEDVFFEWANSDFLNTLVYLRWKKEKNYQRFIKTVQWGNVEFSDPNFKNTLEETREKVMVYLRSFPVGFLNDRDMKVILKEHLDNLESEIENKMYLSENEKEPNLNDLAAFMVVQGLLAPCMEERELIITDYPEITRWASVIDTHTSKRPTLDLYKDTLKMS